MCLTEQPRSVKESRLTHKPHNTHHADVDLTWVTVCEQGADGQQHLGDGEGGAPVVLQDVQTDHALTVDVAVIDPCTKCYLHTQEQLQLK